MQNKQTKLVAYLKKIDSGVEPLLVRAQDPLFFDSLTPVDFAKFLEQQYLSQIPTENIRSSVKLYEPLVGDQLQKMWALLDYSHPLRKILAEHEIYYCLICDLEYLGKKIQAKDILTPYCSEIRQFEHIIQHFSAIEEHFEYEQDIIYPELSKRGLLKLVRLMNTEHLYIRVSITSGVRLLESIGRQNTHITKTKMQAMIKYLSTMIRNHLFVETYIAYPLAIEYIKNPEVWEHIKYLCEEIGYCGTHSESLK